PPELVPNDEAPDGHDGDRGDHEPEHQRRGDLEGEPEHAEDREQDEDQQKDDHHPYPTAPRANDPIRLASSCGCCSGRSWIPSIQVTRTGAPLARNVGAAALRLASHSGSPPPANTASPGTRSIRCSAGGSCSQIARRIRKWLARESRGWMRPCPST